MDRTGNSLLSGTLLFSLLLSPAMRSSPAPGGSPQDSTGAGKSANHKQPSPGVPGLATRTQIEDAAHAQYMHDFDELIREECQEGDRTPHAAAHRASASPCHLDPSNFIVALVPDPVHTHLALGFDRTVDVIEEALQDEGYLFVRSLMPWDYKSHPESDEHVEREETEWDQDAREDKPGLMIFRSSAADDPTPLLLLVVGETPTAGIHKQQFQNAVGKMEALLHAYGDPKFRNFQLNNRDSWHFSDSTPGLRILGPTFSGSLASLYDLLQCRGKAMPAAPNRKEKGLACYPQVSIHSGTISSWSTVDAFERAAQAQSLNAHFISFQESDQVIIERFLDFLTGSDYGRRHYEPDRIVLLSEDETAYGNRLQDPPRPKSKHLSSSKPPNALATVSQTEITPDPRDRDWDAYRRIRLWWRPLFSWLPGLPGRKESLSSSCTDPPCVDTIYFPREISQLRAVYQKDVTQANNDGHPVPRDILPTYSDTPGADDDTVPNYSLRQLPMSQEAILLGIVSELQKHRAQFILLRATDPTDTLFLIRYLRSAYPQGRIVTLDADMLFRREAEDPRFHGLLSLSTYSLATAAHHGFSAYENEHTERIFPDSFEAGTYNALTSLLVAWVGDTTLGNLKGCCRYQLSVHPNQRPLKLYQYGWRQRAVSDVDPGYYAPPVRLLVLGRDQYWPLADLGPYYHERHSSRLPLATRQLISAATPVTIPTSWRAVQFVGLTLALFFCWSLWRSTIFSSWEALAKFAPAVRDRRLSLILINGFTLICLLLILMWPSFHGAGSTGYRLEPILFLAAILVFLTTLLEAVSRGFSPLSSAYSCQTSTSQLKPALEIAGFVLLCFWMVYRTGQGEPPDEYQALIRTYTMLRSTQLSSGLSFIMPVFFFLTAWLWWAGHLSASYALLDERRPRLPDGMKNPRLRSVLPRASSELLDTMRPSGRSFLRYLLIALLLFMPVVFLADLRHPIVSLERYPVEWFMTILFLLTIAGIVALALRVLQIWTYLRKLLTQLDMLPLRDSFKAVEGFSWKPIWQLGSGSLLEFSRIIARKREALDAAAAAVPELVDQGLESQWRTLLKKAAKYKSIRLFRHWFRRREAERRLIRDFGFYQECAALVAGKALDFLAAYWTRRQEKPLALAAASGSPLAFPVHNRRQEDKDPLRDQARACERFVCMSYVTFLLVMLVRLRCLIVAVGGMYVLTLIGISQYPFEPRGALQLALVALLIFIVAVVGFVFAQIHRDTILSNLTKTNPGELDTDFYVKMASFVALPLFSLLASQFPSINRFFYSWLQPAVEALNR
jgi:hypothetical protein